jgi:hypothetical protein
MILLVCMSLMFGGCEGTDTREKVDDTVEEMAGKKNLDRFKQMKDDLGEIQKRKTEKYRQLDEDNDDK